MSQQPNTPSAPDVPSARPTRAEYLAGAVDHSAYYGAVAADAGVRYDPASAFITDVLRALRAGDVHLNTIPLTVWDGKTRRPVPYALAEAFRKRGDYATAAGLVCLHKEAARRAAVARAETEGAPLPQLDLTIRPEGRIPWR